MSDEQATERAQDYAALLASHQQLVAALELARAELNSRAYVQDNDEPNSAMKLLPTLDAALQSAKSVSA